LGQTNSALTDSSANSQKMTTLEPADELSICAIP
jgi:hypothetical protein